MKINLQKNKNAYGFTLLEILITMSIIGVLIAGAFFSYIQIIERSRINQAVSDIQAIARAIEEYHADMGYYPPDTSPSYDPGFLKYRKINCGLGVPCPIGYDKNRLETNPPATYAGPYLDTASWPMETPWGGVYDYEYWPPPLNVSGLPGGCAGMVNGIYISVRRLGPSWFPTQGAGSPPAVAEEYFRQRGQDVCPTNNGVIFYLIKRL